MAAAPPSLEQTVVFEVSSAFATIRVTDYPSSGLRCLDFPPGRIVQTCLRPSQPDELEVPYLRSLTSVLALDPDPRTVLLLGLGGGSLSSFLKRAFPRLAQTVVELDPAVVMTAREWFGYVPAPDTRVVIGDARAFLTKTTARFDLVILDAYGPDDVPAHLSTREFFELVRATLSHRGRLAVNLWGPRANPLYPHQIRTLAEVFDHLAVLSSGRSGPGAPDGNLDRFVPGHDLNRVVVASTAPLPPAAEWAELAREMGRRHGLTFDLAAIVLAECDPDVKLEPGAAPLRDWRR